MQQSHVIDAMEAREKATLLCPCPLHARQDTVSYIGLFCKRDVSFKEPTNPYPPDARQDTTEDTRENTTEDTTEPPY